MNAPENPLKMDHKSLRSLLCLALAAIMFLLALSISTAEHCVSLQIAPALQDMGIKSGLCVSFSDATPAAKVLYLVMLSALTALGIWAGRRQRFPGVLIVNLQIYILSLVAQIFLFIATSVSLLPITSLVTIGLGTACGAFIKHLAEREKLMETQYYELLIRNRELEEARRALVRQDETERRLLAADLHDQVLNDLKKMIDTFKRFEESHDKSLADRIRLDFAKTMTDIREIMDDLSPVMLQNFGLRAAIEDCLDKGKERSGFDGICTSEVTDEKLEKLSDVEQSLLFRLVQESITNICKHAQASTVNIRIFEKGTDLLVSIEDDGKGIDYKTVSHQSRGLRYMKLRADLIGATVEWKDGSTGKGTLVTIRFPYP